MSGGLFREIGIRVSRFAGHPSTGPYDDRSFAPAPGPSPAMHAASGNVLAAPGIGVLPGGSRAGAFQPIRVAAVMTPALATMISAGTTGQGAL